MILASALISVVPFSFPEGSFFYLKPAVNLIDTNTYTHTQSLFSHELSSSLTYTDEEAVRVRENDNSGGEREAQKSSAQGRRRRNPMGQDDKSVQEDGPLRRRVKRHSREKKRGKENCQLLNTK